MPNVECEPGTTFRGVIGRTAEDVSGELIHDPEGRTPRTPRAAIGA
jgi:hypothetical protein